MDHNKTPFPAQRRGFVFPDETGALFQGCAASLSIRGADHIGPIGNG